jgi:LPXTG-motif cell wall-anchored protein
MTTVGSGPRGRVRKGVALAVAALVALGAFLALAQSAAAEPTAARTATPQEEVPVGGVSGFTSDPQPSSDSFDWKQRALDFDHVLYDGSDTGQDATIMKDTTAYNMPAGEDTYKIPSYYGDSRVDGTAGDGSQEAVAQIASVVGATLVGLNKSDQGGQDYVDMLQTFYHPDLGVAMDTPNVTSTSPGSGQIWYSTISNVLYYMLGEQYPDAQNMTPVLRSIADKYYGMVVALGGADADFTMKDFDFAAMQPVSGSYDDGGEAAAGAAAILLWANAKFGDAKYLQGAEWAMDALERSSQNLFYEVIPVMLPYLAARMNAQDGTDYDISGLFRQLMQDSDVRKGWGTITDASWGDKDVSGLVGSRSDSSGYAFAMNTFATPLLAATAKYDPRYANTIGQWMLNVDNNARFFYADQLPANEQAYGDTYRDSPLDAIAYEGIMHKGDAGISATGDICEGRSAGWKPNPGPDATCLGIYGSSWVGFMGAALSNTNVPDVIRTDLNALDFFGANAYPTYLYYNPTGATANVTVSLQGHRSLYDEVSDTVLNGDATGTATIAVPANGSAVLVEGPANPTLTKIDGNTALNGVVAGYDRSAGRDLAASSMASAESSVDGTQAANAVDGDAATIWAADSADSAGAPSITVDLHSPHEVGRAEVRWSQHPASSYTLATSDDRTTWTTAARVDDSDGNAQSVVFPEVSARYVRLTVDSAPDAVVALSELELYDGDLAADAPTGVSSQSKNVVNIGASITDGSPRTRWESATSDPQWATVDLGTSTPIGSVGLTWEAAYAKAFEVQVSDDDATWKTVYSTADAKGGDELIPITPVSARYVRMQGTQRGTKYAYSLYAFDVWAPTGVADTTSESRAPAIAMSSPSAAPGSEVTVSGTGFQSGATVRLTLHSDPVTLGTAQTDATGAFSAAVTIPADVAAGSHTVLGDDGVLSASASLAVTAAAAPGSGSHPSDGTGVADAGGASGHSSHLAQTGSDAIGWSLAAGLLVLVGGCLWFAVARRRRTRIG